MRQDKRKWIDDHLGTYVPLHICESRDKSTVCQPGDVLIDDQPKYHDAWTRRGGLFIHHTTAERTIARLEHEDLING